MTEQRGENVLCTSSTDINVSNAFGKN